MEARVHGGARTGPAASACLHCGAASPAAAPTTSRGSGSGALTEDQIFAQKSLEQLNSERPLAAVFFDLDESAIRPDGRAPPQVNADWLRRWTSTQITVEGHYDERGSSEYNLALGARRAEAVKQYLGEDRTDYFFHRDELRDLEFANLKPGERVTFDAQPSPKGPRAGNVRQA